MNYRENNLPPGYVPLQCGAAIHVAHLRKLSADPQRFQALDKLIDTAHDMAAVEQLTGPLGYTAADYVATSREQAAIAEALIEYLTKDSDAAATKASRSDGFVDAELDRLNVARQLVVHV